MHRFTNVVIYRPILTGNEQDFYTYNKIFKIEFGAEQNYLQYRNSRLQSNRAVIATVTNVTITFEVVYTEFG